MVRQLIAGNWKMNGLSTSLGVIETVLGALTKSPPAADVMICPPATLISRAVQIAGGIAIGAQDCHEADHGAFTGDISATMLRDAGARGVIVGHSERRRFHGETSLQIAAKARAAHGAGLLAIICIGETEAERDQGRAHSVCTANIEESLPESATAVDTAIAYEPVWAIGTGRTPSAREIADMHTHIRGCLQRRLPHEGARMRILYGGSVNTRNAGEILAIEAVDGALVGGASLRAEDFLAVVAAARERR